MHFSREKLFKATWVQPGLPSTVTPVFAGLEDESIQPKSSHKDQYYYFFFFFSHSYKSVNTTVMTRCT